MNEKYKKSNMHNYNFVQMGEEAVKDAQQSRQARGGRGSVQHQPIGAIASKKKQIAAIEKQKREEEELAECTFKPKINHANHQKYLNGVKSHAVIKKNTND